MLPFRLRVLKALTDQIKTVTPSRTYLNTETGLYVPFMNNLADYAADDGSTRERVFRGRELFGTTDPLPMVSILEHPRALDVISAPGHAQQTVTDWDLLVQGFVTDDPDHPTDPAHILAAEVISVIAEAAEMPHDILGLGYRQPAVTKLAIGSPVVRPADGMNSDQAFFWLTLTLTLAEDRKKPFA